MTCLCFSEQSFHSPLSLNQISIIKQAPTTIGEWLSVDASLIAYLLLVNRHRFSCFDGYSTIFNDEETCWDIDNRIIYDFRI